MSEQGNQNLRNAGRAVSGGAGAAKKTVKTGVKAGKTAVKGAERAAAFLSPEALAIIAGVLIVIVLLLAIVEGLNSVQLDNNEYRSAVNEEEENAPANEKEAYEANYDLGLALQQTLDLSDVIHDAKRKEKESIAKKNPGKQIVCESDQTPVLINENYPEYTPNVSSFAGGTAFQQNTVKWVNDTVALKKYGYKTWTSRNPNSKLCPICHPGSGDGWNCIGFTFAAWHHGGGLESKCSCGVMGNNQYEEMYKKGEAWASQHATEKIGVECKVIMNGGKDVPASMMLPGDIMIWIYDNGVYHHNSIYIGDNKYGESTGHSKYVKISKYNDKGVKFIIRYAGVDGGSGASTSTSFTKKDKFTVLGEISQTTGKRYSIGYIRGSNCAQSFAYTGSGYAVSFVTSDHAPAYVQTYDKNGTSTGSIRADAISHANGACMTPEGKYMVAGTQNPTSLTGHIFSVEDTLSKDGTKGLPSKASSIAYDRETEKYVLGTGSSFTIYDKNLSKVEKIFDRNVHSIIFNQDIGAAGGYIFACQTSIKGGENYGKNYVDIYNESTGDYCGSYYVKYGELQSADVVDGELVLLIHILGHVNYIQYTGINAGTGAMTGSLSNYTTKHDLDVLSAYSVTLSNTGLFKTEEKDGEENATWLDKLASGDVGTDNYTDAKGNRLKLYWFGEKRGRVNYKADLKKKLGEGWFSKKKVYFYDVLYGEEALEAMEEDGVDPNGGSSASGGAQAAVDWAKKIAADDSFTYGSFVGRTAGCYFCKTRSDKHYSCMPFVTAAYAHGANDPDVLALCEKKHSLSTYIDSDWQKLIKKGKFIKLGSCRDLSFSDLQPGDILVTYAADDKSGHMAIYAGGDDLVEAVKPGNGPESIRVSVGAAKSKFKKLQNNKNNFVMRYTGQGGSSASTVSTTPKTSSTSSKSNSLILLVNDADENAVPSNYNANLVEIDPDGKGYTAGHDSCKYISSKAKKNLIKMLDDCEKNAGKAIVQSSYRDYDTQNYLYEAAQAAGRTDTTKPGHSEHQTGLAADIIDASSSSWSDPLVKKQEDTKAQKWLMKNCQNYGFILRYPEGKESITGIDYEPWHYRYVGKKAAKEIMSKGICLEEYVKGKSSTSKKAAGDIVYLRERPVSDILEDMDMDPDGTYSGSGRESMFDATNLEAALGMSDNTEHMLYTGYLSVNRNAASLTNLGSGDFGLPLNKGVYTITSHVGKRNAPTAGASTNHAGVDLAAPAGTPIYASLSGTVTVARKTDPGSGYGKYVQISSGDYEIIYGHMSKVLVNSGDTVTRGQNIGLVGTTGTSTGNHLHFEVHKNGKVIDPEEFMDL